MTSRSFSLPDLGEGICEVEILSIPVHAGQAVREGDIILEVETDKAAVEISSPFDGTVAEVLVEPGDLVRVGETAITFTAEAGVEVPEQEPAVGSKKEATRGDVVPASPATRRMARQLGVNLHLVTPSGKGGVVTADDVTRFAEKHTEGKEGVVAETALPAVAINDVIASTQLPDFSQWGEIERQPFRSIRRLTATQMARSWAQIPHVSCQDMVDISKLEDFRQRHKGEIEAAGGRLTQTVFTLKAVATGLKTYPRFNASLDLGAAEIIIKHYCHIGVAVDTEHGLVVPVIRDVDRKSIRELAIELHDKVTRARARKITRVELQGSTFTLTNAGALGGGFFSPIINYPEVAILGLGRSRMQPAVVTNSGGGHEIVPRLLMPIMLCFDHRVVDGADAIRFLQVVMDLLADPDELLMTMI